jgi:hypothetical protein
MIILSYRRSGRGNFILVNNASFYILSYCHVSPRLYTTYAICLCRKVETEFQFHDIRNGELVGNIKIPDGNLCVKNHRSKYNLPVISGRKMIVVCFLKTKGDVSTVYSFTMNTSLIIVLLNGTVLRRRPGVFMKLHLTKYGDAFRLGANRRQGVFLAIFLQHDNYKATHKTLFLPRSPPTSQFEERWCQEQGLLFPVFIPRNSMYPTLLFGYRIKCLPKKGITPSEKETISERVKVIFKYRLSVPVTQRFIMGKTGDLFLVQTAGFIFNSARHFSIQQTYL